MPPRSITTAEVAGKRVLVRVDFNVPIENGEITDDTRIRAALPTIAWLREHGAKVILCSHLGRPKGTRDSRFSLAIAAQRLSELIATPVTLIDEIVGPGAESRVAALQSGDVALLENIRFEPGEETNDPELAKQLAALGDLFVNDAFGAAHRAHASTVGVTQFLPAYAGFLIDSELAALDRVVSHPERPFVAILGGAKVSDKLAVLVNLLGKVDALLIGGGMANTLLLAQGKKIGKSLAEPDLVARGREFFARAAELGVELVIPTDAVTSDSINGEGTVTPVDAIGDNDAIFDIGPDSAARYAEIIGSAKTIFWNGPMGVAEKPQFSGGTREIARAVAASSGYSVVGGGDSVAAVEQLGFASQIDHISTGGGASLEYVEGRVLPGIEAIPLAEG
ncbi:phosphoglycerate kinase [soil metagenome]